MNRDRLNNGAFRGKSGGVNVHIDWGRIDWVGIGPGHIGSVRQLGRVIAGRRDITHRRLY